MKTMTIRNIPDEVAAYISGRALEEGRSINTMTVALLSQLAGYAARPQKKRDLSWLAGSWSQSEARRFDEAVSDCRRVDAEDWK